MTETSQQPHFTFTLCIRYTLDPNRLHHFRTYVEHELEAIRKAGGTIVGYWLPTDFAGPTHIGYGLIDFDSLGSYESYRIALAGDTLHRHNATELVRSGVIVNMERSFLQRQLGRTPDLGVSAART